MGLLWIGAIAALMWWMFPVAFRAIMGTDGIDLYLIQISNSPDMRIVGLVLLSAMFVILLIPFVAKYVTVIVRVHLMIPEFPYKIAIVKSGWLGTKVYLRRRAPTWPHGK